MELPKRVLLTTDAVGGVWPFTFETARGLASRGIEVAVATMGPLPSKDQVDALVQIPGVRLFKSTYALEWMNDPWDEVEEAGDWLLEIERQFRPSIVHLNAYVHADLPWRAPVLVTAHSCVFTWWRAVKKEQPPAYFQEYWRRVSNGLRAAAQVTSPTAAYLEMLVDEYGALSNVSVILNGRDANAFQPAKKEPFIFSAGRLWDGAKNLRLLNEIAPDLAWPVTVAGDHSLENPAALDHVRFLGRLPSKDLSEVLSRAGIYAAPALYEPFGLGILEAALSGCCLVLADIPTLRELWQDAAIFVSPEEPAAWIATLNRLSGNAARRRQMAALALKRALTFQPSQMVEGYLNLYSGMLQESFVEARR